MSPIATSSAVAFCALYSSSATDASFASTTPFLSKSPWVYAPFSFHFAYIVVFSVIGLLKLNGVVNVVSVYQPPNTKSEPFCGSVLGFVAFFPPTAFARFL